MSASYRQVRQYERAPLRERGVLIAGGVSYPGIIGRVGGGGVFFETELDLKKGDVVTLKFRLACLEEAIVVKGEVRWVAEENREHLRGLGIAFLDLDAARRDRIVEFVAERGNVLASVDSLLRDRNADLTRIQDLLSRVDLDNVTSLEDLRERVKTGMQGFFDRF